MDTNQYFTRLRMKKVITDVYSKKVESLGNEFEVLVGCFSIRAVTWWVEENARSNDGFKQHRPMRGLK